MNEKEAMEMLCRPREVRIVQIAITSASGGMIGFIYGVGSDGFVYNYDTFLKAWKPLSNKIYSEGGE